MKPDFLKIAAASVFHLCFFLSAAAQNVILKGVIRDAEKKEPLFAASIRIAGTTRGANSDFEGKYTLQIPANAPMVLEVRMMGYTTKEITLKAIPEGETRTLDVDLSELARESKEVVVTVQRRQDTDISLINDLKKAEMVVNGISSEQIVRSPDRDAAQVMSRVPGVTVVDNRFVMIRGVNERYNSVMINDAISPGTEVDTRAFSFDLIASNMIERMMIYKSGAASLPGEFAGGVVKIYTKNSFAENFTNITLGSAYRANTSFRTGFKTESSGTDGLAFDNGLRMLPSHFPSTDTYKELSTENQLRHARKLNSNFGTNRMSNLPDIRFGLATGRRWKSEERELSMVSSLNYSKTFQNMQIRRYRYAGWNPELQKSTDTLFQFTDNSYSQNVRISAVSNWLLRSGKNQFEFKNLFNQIGDNETVIRNGKNFERSTDSLRSYGYRYISRSLLSSQLIGNHELANKGNLSWVAAYSYTNRNEPDYRRVRTAKAIGSGQPYELIPAASSGALFETGRFFSGLKEHVVTLSSTYTQSLANPFDSSRIALRTGMYSEGKARNFQARYFVYLLKDNRNQNLLLEPLNQMFSAENLASNRFVLEEGTRPEDGYQAQNVLTAAFAELSVPMGKTRTVLGVRPEFNQQMLQSATAVRRVEVNNPVFSPMWFLNISRDLTPSTILRFGYAKTINRPEFRELAPFVYYDFNLDANFVGNPELKVANIHNFDLRAEWYPTKSELVSFGTFFKRFINPIETKITPVGLSPQFTYSNAESANNYGIELEIRKALPGSEKFFFVSNASLIHSRVDLGVVGSQERIRSLQGQSPYVVNGGLYYNATELGLNITALYNVFGKRIFMVGDALFPTIYEMPRHVIDLTISKNLGKRFVARASVSDLLNYQSRFIQDSNRDGKIGSKDEIISDFRRGTLVNFSVTATL